MLRFALGLPHRPGTRAMVVATRAGSRVGSTYTPGFEGTATLVLALILLLKGYQVRATAGIDMPSNWLAVHPGLAPATVAGIVARAEERTERLMATVLAGERHYTWTTFLLGLLLLPVSLLYLLIGRHFLARLFFASEQCTECGLCAENCPHGAIELLRRGEGIQPYWTYRCESCMRCIAYCPTEAVEASYVLGAGAYALAAALPLSAVLGWLAVRLPVLAGLRRAPRWITDRASVFAALALLYPIVTLLLRHRGFNRLYTRAAPTHYYRRYHEPGTRLKNLR
jgi:ferredoxin